MFSACLMTKQRNLTRLAAQVSYIQNPLHRHVICTECTQSVTALRLAMTQSRLAKTYRFRTYKFQVGVGRNSS
jgi:hypothetical protein